MQLRAMRIIQSPCRANTNKPVTITLKAMQLANATIDGLKSDATTAVGVAVRALQIKKAIIAKYETIIASTNRNRSPPNLLASTRNGTTSVTLCKPTP
jgi:nucleoside recognition membrane protein YjiH